MARWTVKRAAVCAAALASGALADQILVTTGFTQCDSDSTIQVNKVDITYNNDAKTIDFDLAGTSKSSQNVTATLVVKAYGQEVYRDKFNPCEKENFVEALCPGTNHFPPPPSDSQLANYFTVPAGDFSARGSQEIPPQFAGAIPSIAFQIPDIAAMATLELKALDDERNVGCIKSQVSNGKTANTPGVTAVVAGVAGAAFVATGASALGAALSGASGGASGGAGTMSPSFTEMMGVFQGFAMNGMMSVNYPPVYRSFAKNFGFSAGMFPWRTMQLSIDDFREATGGDLTRDGVKFLENATLIFPDGSQATPNKMYGKRALHGLADLVRREIEAEVNGTASEEAAAENQSGMEATVAGIKAYAEELAVPSANSFMTVLLITAIIIATIIVIMLLVKVVLEAWSLFGSFPQSLTGFRKHYWGSIARTITTLIMLLYGIWALYSVFQFTHGDSWAAQTLAGVTLALFTAVLAFFTFKIWRVVRKLRQQEGDVGALYDDKNIWMKYSLFYESYKRDYWWMFVPLIAYMFAKGTVLASTDGNGMAQTIAMLVVEGMMLGLLLWSRPFERKSGNIINIAIQTVRFLSIICVLFFVEEFGIAETTQTVTGVVLISIQSALTGILAILVIANALIACFKMNPHRQRRKELGKLGLPQFRDRGLA